MIKCAQHYSFTNSCVNLTIVKRRRWWRDEVVVDGALKEHVTVRPREGIRVNLWFIVYGDNNEHVGVYSHIFEKATGECWETVTRFQSGGIAIDNLNVLPGVGGEDIGVVMGGLQIAGKDSGSLMFNCVVISLSDIWNPRKYQPRAPAFVPAKAHTCASGSTEVSKEYHQELRGVWRVTKPLNSHRVAVTHRYNGSTKEAEFIWM